MRHKVRILIFGLVQVSVKNCACTLPQEVVCGPPTLYETVDLRIHLLLLIHPLLEYLLSTQKPWLGDALVIKRASTALVKIRDVIGVLT